MRLSLTWLIFAHFFLKLLLHIDTPPKFRNLTEIASKHYEFCYQCRKRTGGTHGYTVGYTKNPKIRERCRSYR